MYLIAFARHNTKRDLRDLYNFYVIFSVLLVIVVQLMQVYYKICNIIYNI